ncbi:sulfate permease [Pararhodobacter sp. SW119]|uniref:SulP family inorganic anion transporter n=1 Tax=Pararhodobacter sp. SW119 TaxID=2780075 RepID=UPI001FD75D73|nr:sulfate permease [Pararhodobacter sp. SW119]
MTDRMNGKGRGVRRFLPILDWGRDYRFSTLADDLLAAVIVTIMLVPQSLAYAMLAGLPPQVGLYASILPLVAYAIFGTSRTLAVGPVAVISLMTAAAVGQLALTTVEGAIAASAALAALSGLMLMAMGVLRLGFLANFLSHPVIAGFITASGLLIAVSQLRHILGIAGGGHTLPEMLVSLSGNLGQTNLPTLKLGLATLGFLFAARSRLNPLLRRLGLPARAADIATKVAPIVAVVATIAAAAGLGLADAGVRIVGEIPSGLPPFGLPTFDPGLWLQLAGAALLLSVIGFVESVSVAQTLAAKRRERIDPDQELVGLGASNVASAVSGGFPVTGGFARSVVNFDAGARTPAAGAFTAGGIALGTVFLTPWLFYLPQATLAATIIVAVLGLVDLGVLKRTWNYSKADFAAVAVTIALTLGLGVEAGVVAGVAVSLALFLYRTSRPHMAVVGLVPGTQHFRNILRHDVRTSPRLLSLRVDESLYFANARYLEDRLYDMVAARPELEHVVLMCPAVNEIDASALESLEAINEQLKTIGVAFHLSEVKGPVMDQLKRTDFLDHLSGQIFLSHYQAIAALDPSLLDRRIAPGSAASDDPSQADDPA